MSRIALSDGVYTVRLHGEEILFIQSRGLKDKFSNGGKKKHYKLNKKEALFTVFFDKVNAIVISEKKGLLFENSLFVMLPRVADHKG